MWINGRAPAFQAGGAGSIPVIRSRAVAQVDMTSLRNGRRRRGERLCGMRPVDRRRIYGSIAKG